jgi:hypothetical protein
MATKKLVQTVSSKKFSTKFHGADNASVEAVAACLQGEYTIYDRAGVVGTEAEGNTTPATYSTGLFQYKNSATGSVGYWNAPYIKTGKTIEEVSLAIKINMKCPDGTTPDQVTAMGFRQIGA